MAAIELESLAVAWAIVPPLNHFILETDQKPLETVLAKSLNQLPPDCREY